MILTLNNESRTIENSLLRILEYILAKDIGTVFTGYNVCFS